MQVSKYLAKQNWYYVTYEDGDDEELTHAELKALLEAPAPADSIPAGE